MKDISLHLSKMAQKNKLDLLGTVQLQESSFKQEIINWVQQSSFGQMTWYANNLSRRLDPRQHLWGKARSAIVAGVFYRPPQIPAELRDDPSRGLIAAYAWYDDYHKWFKKRLVALAKEFAAWYPKDFQYRVYVDTGPLLEKELAAQAELGFIGKNTTFINQIKGSYFFLGEIIVDIDLPKMRWQAAVDAEIDLPEATCGLCRRCLTACPTGALTAPYKLDARLCISYLTIEHRGVIPENLRPLMKNWIFGCDICQIVCPWNKKVKDQSDLPLREEMIAPSLLDLVKLSENDFLAYFRKSPVLRTGYSGFMRNVMIALGNWADKRAQSAVEKFLHHPDEIIRDHAKWAWQQVANK